MLPREYHGYRALTWLLSGEQFNAPPRDAGGLSLRRDRTMSNKLSPIKLIVTSNVLAPVRARNRVNCDPGHAVSFQSAVQRGAASMLNGNSQLISEASLWALNIAAVFFATYYLFGMNNRGIFFGYDSQSFRTLFGISYRLSEMLFGLGSDFVNGIGNVSADPNPR